MSFVQPLYKAMGIESQMDGYGPAGRRLSVWGSWGFGAVLLRQPGPSGFEPVWWWSLIKLYQLRDHICRAHADTMTICYWESLDQPMASIYIDSSSIYSWVRRACFRPRLLPGGFPEIWCIFRLIGTRENPFIIYIQTFDHCCHGSPCAKLVWSSFEWQGYVPRGERHGTTRMPNSWNPGWKKWSPSLPRCMPQPSCPHIVEDTEFVTWF